MGIIQTQIYYIPDARIRLLSLQTYFKENRAGSVCQDHEKVQLETPRGEQLMFPYNTGSNLPLMFLDDQTQQVGMTRTQVANPLKSEDVKHTITLLNKNNHNLSRQQNELMLWHHGLGHADFRWIQNLMLKPKVDEGDNKEPPVIPVKNLGTHCCETPWCPACQLSKAQRQTPGSSQVLQKPEQEIVIQRLNLNPGDCILVDQYQAWTHTHGCEPETEQYVGGTIYINHSSGYIFHHHQMLLQARTTIQGKHKFETCADQFGIKLKTFHADNHPFAQREIMMDVELQDPEIKFSGVGAHHQNGASEQAIQTVISWALCYMMHQLMHWPACFQADLWPFAFNHAVTIWNHLPQAWNGLCPLELFTRTKFPQHDAITNARVFRCPIYVLNPNLQDGKKLPKWSKKSQQGMYLGHSWVHYHTVSNILSLKTGNVLPQ